MHWDSEFLQDKPRGCKTLKTQALEPAGHHFCLVPLAEQGARPRMWTIGGTIHYFNILPQLLAYPCPRVWNDFGNSILWQVDTFTVLSANFLHGFSGNYFVQWGRVLMASLVMVFPGPLFVKFLTP